MLKGVSIFDNHAVIKFEEGSLVIQTFLYEAAQNVFINGEGLENYEDEDFDE